MCIKIWSLTISKYFYEVNYAGNAEQLKFIFHLYSDGFLQIMIIKGNLKPVSNILNIRKQDFGSWA